MLKMALLVGHHRWYMWELIFFSFCFYLLQSLNENILIEFESATWRRICIAFEWHNENKFRFKRVYYLYIIMSLSMLAHFDLCELFVRFTTFTIFQKFKKAKATCKNKHGFQLHTNSFDVLHILQQQQLLNLLLANLTNSRVCAQFS